MGIDKKNGTELEIEMTNKAGGLKVGGDTYQLQGIYYDTRNDQATAVAAANRLVFEDKVKFILHDEQLCEAYIPICEENHIVLLGGTASQATVKPGLNYSAFMAGTNFAFPIGLAWYVKNHPDLITNYVFVAPDDQNGHFSIDNFMEPILLSLGVKPSKVFYPAGQTDLSAVATKVVSLNPTTVDCSGGGSIMDIQAMKAVWQAGYKGQFFTGGGVDPFTAKQFLPPEGLDGSIASARAQEFDPPLTQIATDIKNAYIAKTGKWESPSIDVDNYIGLLAAIKQADSLDVDKVMAVIYGGLKFEGLNGPTVMVPRPDLGPTQGKTRDSIATCIIHQYKGDVPVVLATIPPNEGLKYYQMVHPDYQP
jgi:branched-chain amino acid transport system substrate-binding protein